MRLSVLLVAYLDPLNCASRALIGALFTSNRGGDETSTDPRVGIMGEIADAVLAQGGQVIGVMPQALVDKEVSHSVLS